MMNGASVPPGKATVGGLRQRTVQEAHRSAACKRRHRQWYVRILRSCLSMLACRRLHHVHVAGVWQQLSWTDRLLSVWIIGAMGLGLILGKFTGALPAPRSMP